MIFGWCRQASERGALQGDLCRTQSLALDIVYMLTQKDGYDMQERVIKHLSGMLDLWMAFEHHQAWEESKEMKRRREEDKSSEVDLGTLNADDMSSLMEKIRAINGD